MWSVAAIEALFAPPFDDLLLHAREQRRAHCEANSVQLSALLSTKWRLLGAMRVIRRRHVITPS